MFCCASAARPCGTGLGVFVGVFLSFSFQQGSAAQVVDAAPDTAPLTAAARWEALLGRALLATHRGDAAAALAEVNRARVHITLQAGPSALESYPRSHPLMVQLHMLWDLEQLGVAPTEASAEASEPLRASMRRIEASVVDVESRTRMLALLSALAALHGAPAVAAEAALRQAAACRAVGHCDAAWTGVLRAERGGALAAFALKAKLLWDAARHTEAAGVLQVRVFSL